MTEVGEAERKARQCWCLKFDKTLSLISFDKYIKLHKWANAGSDCVTVIDFRSFQICSHINYSLDLLVIEQLKAKKLKAKKKKGLWLTKFEDFRQNILI